MREDDDVIELSEYDESEPVKLSDEDIRVIEEKVNGVSLRYRRDDKVVIKTDDSVGVVALPQGRLIEIQPKVGNPNLVTLLRYANGAQPTHLSRETELQRGTSFVDTVAALYLEELEELLSQGLRREYVETQDSEKYLRGRLNVQRQLAGGIGKTDFECDYDEFTYETALNQTVLCATSILASLADDVEISGSLREHVSRLRRRMTLREVSVEEAEQIELTRLDEHYERILYLSKLVLRNIYIEDIVVGEEASYSLLISMNEVFEKIVERTARESVRNRDGWSVEGQASTDNLLRSEGGSPKRNIRPDFVVRKDGEAVLVGDAKWKEAIKNNDIYQVVSYQKVYEAPCALVYPDNDGDLENTYTVKNGYRLDMLELPTGEETTEVDDFRDSNVSGFTEFLEVVGEPS